MSLFPVDQMVQPVDGHADLVQFRQDFLLSEKAVGSQTIVENEDGDLIIEGYAAVFEGLDREGENFVPGAFKEGIKAFLEGQSALCYHHKHDKVLGKVLELREVEGKGLWMKARVDSAIKTHPELGTYFQQIKKGSINALSIGGFFKRAIVAGRKMISGVDFTEISCTPVPVHSGTHFAVVAGKALETPGELAADNVETYSKNWGAEQKAADEAADELRNEVAELKQNVADLVELVSKFIPNEPKTTEEDSDPDS